jgi:hypothetical protein
MSTAMGDAEELDGQPPGRGTPAPRAALYEELGRLVHRHPAGAVEAEVTQHVRVQTVVSEGGLGTEPNASRFDADDEPGG